MKTAVSQAEPSARSLFASLVPPEAGERFSFLWLSNFESERFWTNQRAVQLPKISQPADSAIVTRLEEMVLFLAESPDTVVLRERSDPAFLDYVSSYGYRLPTILETGAADKSSSISESILANNDVCKRIAEISGNGSDYFLLSYANTRLEEELVRRTGIRSLGTPATVCEHVNSKIYSRRITNELGLRSIPGWECESIRDLELAFDEASKYVDEGHRLVLKESMGVSGKGLFVIDSPQKLDQIRGRLKRKDAPSAEFAFVLECWLEKCKDLNYQIFVSPTGDTRLLTIKEILAEGGVQNGHRFPPDISSEQRDCYRQAAEAIGTRLFKDRYTGIAGIDSIIDQEGTVYPVLEINARFNMSTFQLGLQRLFDPSGVVIARHYPLMIDSKLQFERLIELIGADLFRPGGSCGVLIQNFATVNVNYTQPGEPFKGRLYVLLAGEDAEQVSQLHARLDQRLKEI